MACTSIALSYTSSILHPVYIWLLLSWHLLDLTCFTCPITDTEHWKPVFQDSYVTVSVFTELLGGAEGKEKVTVSQRSNNKPVSARQCKHVLIFHLIHGYKRFVLCLSSRIKYSHSHFLHFSSFSFTFFAALCRLLSFHKLYSSREAALLPLGKDLGQKSRCH